MAAPNPTSATAAPAAAALVSLPRLVSTCVDACHRGLLVIRSVQSRREAALAEAGTEAASSSAPPGAGAGGEAASDANARLLGAVSDHGIQYKVEGDSRSALTEADGASQRVILDCLRARWGAGLRTVGEEEEDNDHDRDDKDEESDGGGDGDVFERYGVPTVRDLPLREDLLVAAATTPSGTGAPPLVPLSSLTIYVDPMDGTREFVEGRLRNVQCLIGITADGMGAEGGGEGVVAGVIGLPFPPPRGDGDGDEGKTQVVYGVAPPPVKGVGETSAAASAAGDDRFAHRALGRLSFSSTSQDVTSLPFLLPEANDAPATSPAAPKKLIALTGDSYKPDKALAFQHLNSICADEGVEIEVSTQGGCGNKMLQVATLGARGEEGNDALAVMPAGTSSWDTAAPTGVINAAFLLADLGCVPAVAAADGDGTTMSRRRPGMVTDFKGNGITYDGVNLTNDGGVLVSSGELGERLHRELCRRLREDGE